MIALLPTIVAQTPLRNVVISALLPTNDIRVSVGSASFGWFTPPSVGQVEVFDASGDVLFRADSISTDRAPGNLLLDPQNLGLIEIGHPSIYLKLRADGNNIEDALMKAVASVAPGNSDQPSAEAASKSVTVGIRAYEGTIFAEDAATDRRWRIDAIEANYFNHADPSGFGRGNLSGEIANVYSQNTEVGAQGKFVIHVVDDDNNKEKLTLQATNLPLGLADAILRRYVTGTKLSGMLSGEGAATWTASGRAFPKDLSTSGALTIDRLNATAPILAGDRLQLTRVELPWRLSAQQNGVVIDDLRMTSDVGQFAARGTIGPNKLSQSPDASAFDLELRGTVDVARLAAMLPHALRIRSDTTITSGTIQLAARTQPADGGQLVTGSLKTAQLAATSAGRPIRWDQPVSANFTLRREQGVLRLDTLKCESDFLTVDASGTPQQLTASAQFDLNRLAEQLGQFVDLNGVVLAGTGSAKLNWQQTAQNQFSATASGELLQLRIAMGEKQISTSQSNFTANVRSAGGAVDVSDAKIQIAGLRTIGPGWNINEPRADLTGDAHWNAETGEISTGAAQLVTSALSVATKDMRYRAPQTNGGQPGIGQLTGMGAFRADLARLASWRASPQQAQPISLAASLPARRASRSRATDSPVS